MKSSCSSCEAGTLARPVPSLGWLTSPVMGGRRGGGDSQPVALVTALATAPRVVKGEGQRLTQPRAHRDAAAFQPRGLSGHVTHRGPNPHGAEHGGLPREPRAQPVPDPSRGLRKHRETLTALGSGSERAAPALPPHRIQVGNRKPDTRRVVLSPCQEPRTEISLISPRCE